MKIEIQNKFYFWLIGEIKNNSQFNKKQPKKFKQSKEWGSELKFKINFVFLLNGEIEMENQFNKTIEKN